MTGEINMSKLDTKPELEEKKKTGTLPKLKFTATNRGRRINKKGPYEI